MLFLKYEIMVFKIRVIYAINTYRILTSMR